MNSGNDDDSKRESENVAARHRKAKFILMTKVDNGFLVQRHLSGKDFLLFSKWINDFICARLAKSFLNSFFIFMKVF